MIPKAPKLKAASVIVLCIMLTMKHTCSALHVLCTVAAVYFDLTVDSD